MQQMGVLQSLLDPPKCYRYIFGVLTLRLRSYLPLLGSLSFMNSIATHTASLCVACVPSEYTIGWVKA